MNPLLKTPPGSRSKCSSSMAWSMREPILVTLETSSYESSFFSRALRNLSPNSPTGVYRGLREHHRISGAGVPLPRGLEVGKRSGDQNLERATENLDFSWACEKRVPGSVVRELYRPSRTCSL